MCSARLPDGRRQHGPRGRDDLGLRGTLGTADLPVGFKAIRVEFGFNGLPPDRLERLKERTERYCVVFQTLLTPPPIEVRWVTG
jgi:hypothetical protein